MAAFYELATGLQAPILGILRAKPDRTSPNGVRGPRKHYTLSLLG
jgi:hypothetical protein